MMKLATRRYLTLGAIVLTLIRGAAFIACDGGSDTSGMTDDDVGDAAQVEGDEHDADADDHDADTDANASADLEAAPKEQLYLVEMSSFAFTPNALEVGTGELLELVKKKDS